MRKQPPAPAPCVVTRFVDGQPIATETVVRDPLPRERPEPARLVRRFRVMAEQETGEEMFVSYASSLVECDLDIARHMAKHPEHRACWFERL